MVLAKVVSLRALRGPSAAVVVGAAAVLALAGCSRSTQHPAAAAAVTDPVAGGTAADSMSGIRFALPAGYLQMSSQAQITAIYAAKPHPGQGIPRYVGGEIVAIQPSTLTVVQAAATKEFTGDAQDVRSIQGRVTTALATAGAKGVSSGVVKVGPDDALRSAYRTGTGDAVIQHVDVVFAHANRYYALTFSGAHVDPQTERTVLASLTVPGR